MNSGVRGYVIYEPDGDLKHLVESISAEPSITVGFNDVSIDEGKRKTEESYFDVRPGIGAAVKLDRKRLWKKLSKEVHGRLEAPHSMLAEYILLRGGISKMFSFGYDKELPGHVYELIDAKNEPFTVNFEIGLDGIINLEYIGHFGRYNDHNEAWLKYFSNFDAYDILGKEGSELNTIGMFAIGIDDDWGRRNRALGRADMYFLKDYANPMLEHDDKTIPYKAHVLFEIDSTGGGELKAYVPLPDSIIRKLPGREYLALVGQDNAVRRENSLEIIMGIGQKTFPDAESLLYVMPGIKWRYKNLGEKMPKDRGIQDANR